MRAHSQIVCITPCITDAPKNAVVDGPVVGWFSSCLELVDDIPAVVSWYALIVVAVKKEECKLKKERWTREGEECG
jgi:hypothetical protein